MQTVAIRCTQFALFHPQLLQFSYFLRLRFELRKTQKTKNLTFLPHNDRFRRADRQAEADNTWEDLAGRIRGCPTRDKMG
jgi:hypothetical protein